jgi:hypothetical protein
MAGLVPAIHHFLCRLKDVDARDKRGHDELRAKTCDEDKIDDRAFQTR